jgi:sporulation-control protein spo0M
MVTPDFQALIPLLHRRQFHLAIATHSDELEYGDKVQPLTHILGRELAQTMVRATFPPDIAEAFFVVAYNPRVRKAKEENTFKRHHMREVQTHFGVQPHEMVFFDDVASIVEDCRQTCGVVAVCVRADVGFQLDDLIKNLI